MEIYFIVLLSLIDSLLTSLFFIAGASLPLFFLLILAYMIYRESGKHLLVTRKLKHTLIFLAVCVIGLVMVDSIVRMIARQHIMNINGKDIMHTLKESDLKGKTLDETEKYLTGYYKQIKIGEHEEYFYVYRGGLFDDVIFWVPYVNNRCAEIESWYGWNDNIYGFPMAVQWGWLLIIFFATISFSIIDFLFYKFVLSWVKAKIHLGSKQAKSK